MKGNLLNLYVSKRLKSIENQLAAYKKDQNPEMLHMLRVNIKQIRAVLSLVKEICNKSCNSNEMKPLFQDAGQIRTLQINLKILNELPHPPELPISQIAANEKVLTGQFMDNIPEYLTGIDKFRNDFSLPNILPDDKIKNYIAMQVKKANKLIVKQVRENLHCFRKRVKKIIYAYDVLPATLQKTVVLNKSELNKLQKKLGKWHDTFSVIDFLLQQEFPDKIKYISKLKAKEEKQFINLFIVNRKVEIIMKA
jgi:CHAD domain-containing protein